MSDVSLSDRKNAAVEMLEVFDSVGAERFSLTITDMDGKMTDYRSNCTKGILRQHLSYILFFSSQGKKNVIIRPHASEVSLIQLDDLSASAVESLRELASLSIATSCGNFQAWIAARGVDQQFVKSVRLGTGADPSASGATRIAGSYNFKKKYQPNFPLVQIERAAGGRIVDRSQLEPFSQNAEPVSIPRQLPPRHASSSRPRRFPLYHVALDKAPRRKDGSPDRSKADFFWCYLAAKWGWSVSEIAAELMRVSTKAQEKGLAYATLTAVNASANSGKHGGGAR